MHPTKNRKICFPISDVNRTTDKPNPYKVSPDKTAQEVSEAGWATLE
jgi:hypothetical protein